MFVIGLYNKTRLKCKKKGVYDDRRGVGFPVGEGCEGLQQRGDLRSAAGDCTGDGREEGRRLGKEEDLLCVGGIFDWEAAV